MASPGRRRGAGQGFPQGVFFVALAAVRDAEVMWKTLADSLDVRRKARPPSRLPGTWPIAGRCWCWTTLSNSTGPAQWAEDAALVLDALRTRFAALLSISASGAFAAACAAVIPGLIRSLTLIAPLGGRVACPGHGDRGAAVLAA